MSTPDFIGELNFQSDKVPRGVAGDGTVYAVVDSTTGGFSKFVGLDPVPVATGIHNGRQAPHLKLDTAGFELREHPLPDINFYNEDQVLTTYYEEVCRYVKEALGAYQVTALRRTLPTPPRRCLSAQSELIASPSLLLCVDARQVYAFDHVVRNSDVSLKYAVKDGVKVGGPALMVHGDYAMRGAPVRRDDFFRPPKLDDTFSKTHGSRPLIPPAEMDGLSGRRFAIVNLWRSIVQPPVVDLPLAMCDCATVLGDDYTAVEFRYVDRSFETYLGHHSDQQRWYYFPQMTCNEVRPTHSTDTLPPPAAMHQMQGCVGVPASSIRPLADLLPLACALCCV